MDYAPIVSTALGIVFILQIILIIQVSSLMKRMKGRKFDFSTSKPFIKGQGVQEGKKTKRDQPVESKAPVTTVEKSLRDINLRLKNAERDQERARKKLSTIDSGDPRRKPAREGFKKSIKRRDGGRKKHTIRERPSFKPSQEKAPDTFQPPPPVIKEPPLDSQKQAVIPTSQVESSPEQGFGRGSKIIVKRRSLENGKPEEKPPDEQPSATDVTEAQKEQNISFGRR